MNWKVSGINDHGLIEVLSWNFPRVLTKIKKNFSEDSRCPGQPQYSSRGERVTSKKMVNRAMTLLSQGVRYHVNG
jgi:hypothetical protein